MGASAGPSLQGIGRGGASNLVLEMDAHDAKSYPGEPTTNLIYSSSFGTNQNVTNTNNIEYGGQVFDVKCVSNQAGSSPGIFNNPSTVAVTASTDYTFSLRGFKAVSAGSVYFYVQNVSGGGDLVWHGTELPTEEEYFSDSANQVVVLNFNTSTCTSLRTGVLFSGPAIGDAFYLADCQLEKKSYATPFVVNQAEGTGVKGMNARPATINLMIHGNVGTGQSFSDSSPSGHTITANGDVTHSGGQSKFSGGSIYFDGTGDYLTIPASGDWDVGTGDWTFDCWAYTTTSASYAYVFDTRSGSYTNNFSLYRNGLNLVYYAQASALITATGGMTLNTWRHIALVRSGSTVTMYIDGLSVGSATDANDYQGLAPFAIGTRHNIEGYWQGYQDEFRFTKGTALWLSAFTPPTRRNLSAPVVDRVNYNGFNCTSTAVTDQATYRDGEVIRLTTPTDALNNIKSAVWDFDGTDDKLFGGVANFDPTGPGTINLWLNQDSGNSGITTCLGNASASDRYFNIHPSNTSLMRMGVVSSGGWQYKTFTDNLLDRWAMLTIVNTGSSASPSTYSVYLNGTAHADNPVTYTGSFSDPTDLFVLGNYTLNNSYDTDGQIANVQIYKVALTPQQVKENFNQQRNRFKI